MSQNRILPIPIPVLQLFRSYLVWSKERTNESNKNEHTNNGLDSNMLSSALAMLLLLLLLVVHEINGKIRETWNNIPSMDWSTRAHKKSSVSNESTTTSNKQKQRYWEQKAEISNKSWSSSSSNMFSIVSLLFSYLVLIRICSFFVCRRFTMITISVFFTLSAPCST